MWLGVGLEGTEGDNFKDGILILRSRLVSNCKWGVEKRVRYCVVLL